MDKARAHADDAPAEGNSGDDAIELEPFYDDGSWELDNVLGEVRENLRMPRGLRSLKDSFVEVEYNVLCVSGRGQSSSMGKLYLSENIKNVENRHCSLQTYQHIFITKVREEKQLTFNSVPFK